MACCVAFERGTRGTRSERGLFQKGEGALRYLQLVVRALTGRFIGPPAHRTRAVPDTSAGDLIERDFEHQRVLQLDVAPLALGIAAPAAGRVTRRCLLYTSRCV